MSEMTRRDFLTTATVAACACAFCGVGDTLAEAVAETLVDVGDLKSFDKDVVLDTWAKSHRFLLIRNDGRLYASSARCTHKGQPLKLRTGEIVCPSHGSKFSHYGTVTKGPAKASLARFGISTNDAGHVIVDLTQSFEEKKWDEVGSYVKIGG